MKQRDGHPDGDSARKRRERAYHDRRFASDPRSATARYYQVDRGKARHRDVVIGHAGRGVRALEYGCGTGSMALTLGRTGAHVTGIDISGVAVAAADETVERRWNPRWTGARPRFVQMDAEHLAFDDGVFDLVCGSAILHHLRLEPALSEIARVLAPGGRAVFLEPLGHNPLINGYRRLTPSLRTDDERPLRVADLELCRRYFDDVHVEHFDLLALTAVPFRQRARAGALLVRLHQVDDALFRRSALARRWSWMVLLSLSRSSRHDAPPDGASRR